jgi:radical SAM superfamily enzyme YgiQ (UPF0313 family)
MLEMVRPHSESLSLPIRVTWGCSHNECRFCHLYRDQPFQVRPWEDILADVRLAKAYGPAFSRVFLGDGDALVAPTLLLEQTLKAIATELPWVTQVSIYGDTRCRKSLDELKTLRRLGLTAVYHGLESGSDALLVAVNKGATRSDAIALAGLLRGADIRHCVLVLLGLAEAFGSYSQVHAEETATALSQIDPPWVSAIVNRSADFTVNTGKLAQELRTLLSNAHFSDCRFHANLAPSLFPTHLRLPMDLARALEVLSYLD